MAQATPGEDGKVLFCIPDITGFTGASGLTLKIVAHYGPAMPMQVGGRSKFVGTGVIAAHRLLKNSLAQREYLLLTDELLDAQRASSADLAPFSAGADSYDELGAIGYKVLPLAPYLVQVRVEPPLPFKLASPLHVTSIAQHVKAPMPAVFQQLIDLPGRINWIAGAKKVELRDDGPNHLGTRHRCIRDGGDPELVTSDVKVNENSMEMWETDARKLGAARFLLSRAAGDTTDVTVEFYVRSNPLVRLFFKFAMQKKLELGFSKSLLNLARLCEAAA